MIRRILLSILVVILALMAWLGYQVHAVYTEVSATYHPAPRISPEPKATPVTNFFGNHRINILLLGSDNDAKFQIQRYPLTQSMIVVSIDPVHDTVNMLSIPRDFWVSIPGYGMDKIDTASEQGGISLARATVESLFHLKIDYYAWVGLNGFSRLVDDFGGVTINVTHPILDDFYPNDLSSADLYGYMRIFIPPGWHHLSGRQALEYVRSRHGDLTGDFGRSQRQQQVLLQLRHQANGWNLLFKIPELASALGGMLRTDLGPTKLLDLARLSRSIQPSSIKRVVLSAPTYCSFGTSPDGQSILVPNWRAITPVVRKLFAPSNAAPMPLASHATSTPSPTSSTPVPTSTVTAHHSSRATATPAPTKGTRLPGNLIYTANGTVYQINRHDHVTDIMPTWMSAADMPSLSANGKLLAFMRWAPNASNIDIYNLKTRRAPRQITNDAPADPTFVSNGLWAAWPSWSRDGKTILFSSDRYKLQESPDQARVLDLAIYAMNPDGTNVRQLTVPATGAGGDTDPQFVGSSTAYLYDHWAYSLKDGLAVGQPYSQLRIRALDNPTAVWTLTPPSGQIVQPTLDRSGKLLAFVQSSGGSRSRLVVAHLGRTKRGFRLREKHVIASGEIAQPAFSPGGHWISFLETDGNGFAIYLEPAQGGPTFKLNVAGNQIDAISRPIWTP